MENNEDKLILEVRNELDLDIEDSELVTSINQAIKNSNKIKIDHDKQSKESEEYWKIGTLKSVLDGIHPRKAHTVNNRIWANIMTILPYWINRTPEPTIIGDIDNNTRERITKALQIAWEVNDDMKWKMQKVVLNWLINRIGWLKLRWSEETGKVETDVVKPSKIGFDKRATSLKDCEYIWEVLEDTAENIAEKYSEKKKDIYNLIGGEEKKKSKLQYIEFWGGNGKWVAWKLKNIILDKYKNPNFDFENKENNIFKKPQFPHLLLNVFNLGNNLYDDTGPLEQAKLLQDSANKLERQILDLNEGQKRVWIGSAEAISEDSFQSVIDETGDFGVYMDKSIPQGGLQLPLSGKPDASLFNNLSHLLSEIDNVMGVHAATRGQYQQGMAGIGMKGYGMMISQDLAKDLVVSRIEQLAEDWFNGYLQMTKVYNENASFNGQETSVSLIREDLNDVRVMVKKGTMIPVDRKARADMAIDLAKLKLSAPADTYNDLGYGDTDKRLKNLEEFLQGQIIPTDQTEEGQQLSKIMQMIQSPEFKKLSPNDQKKVIDNVRGIVEQIKVKNEPTINENAKTIR